MNRKDIHINATGGSGGTAFLINNRLLREYKPRCMEHELPGITILELKNIHTNRCINVIGTYIPPDKSSHADYNEHIFQALLELLFELSEKSDFTMVCGDMNARVGNRKDYIETVDDLPTRTIVDEVVNDQGISLINLCL